MSAIVARVKVVDDGPTRRTTITIVEGPTRVPADVDTLPGAARDALASWLTGSTDQPWRGEHGSTAHLELAGDALGPDARTGFTAPRQ